MNNLRLDKVSLDDSDITTNRSRVNIHQDGNTNTNGTTDNTNNTTKHNSSGMSGDEFPISFQCTNCIETNTVYIPHSYRGSVISTCPKCHTTNEVNIMTVNEPEKYDQPPELPPYSPFSPYGTHFMSTSTSISTSTDVGNSISLNSNMSPAQSPKFHELGESRESIFRPSLIDIPLPSAPVVDSYMSPKSQSQNIANVTPEQATPGTTARMYPVLSPSPTSPMSPTSPLSQNAPVYITTALSNSPQYQSHQPHQQYQFQYLAQPGQQFEQSEQPGQPGQPEQPNKSVLFSLQQSNISSQEVQQRLQHPSSTQLTSRKTSTYAIQKELTEGSFEGDIIGPVPFHKNNDTNNIHDIHDMEQGQNKNYGNKNEISQTKKIRFSSPNTRTCQCPSEDYSFDIDLKKQITHTHSSINTTTGNNDDDFEIIQNRSIDPYDVNANNVNNTNKITNDSSHSTLERNLRGLRPCLNHSSECIPHQAGFACISCRLWFCKHCFPQSHATPSAKLCRWVPTSIIDYLWVLYIEAMTVTPEDLDENLRRQAEKERRYQLKVAEKERKVAEKERKIRLKLEEKAEKARLKRAKKEKGAGAGAGTGTEAGVVNENGGAGNEDFESEKTDSNPNITNDAMNTHNGDDDEDEDDVTHYPRINEIQRVLHRIAVPKEISMTLFDILHKLSRTFGTDYLLPFTELLDSVSRHSIFIRLAIKYDGHVRKKITPLLQSLRTTGGVLMNSEPSKMKYEDFSTKTGKINREDSNLSDTSDLDTDTDTDSDIGGDGDIENEKSQESGKIPGINVIIESESNDNFASFHSSSSSSSATAAATTTATATATATATNGFKIHYDPGTPVSNEKLLPNIHSKNTPTNRNTNMTNKTNMNDLSPNSPTSKNSKYSKYSKYAKYNYVGTESEITIGVDYAAELGYFTSFEGTTEDIALRNFHSLNFIQRWFYDCINSRGTSTNTNYMSSASTHQGMGNSVAGTGSNFSSLAVVSGMSSNLFFRLLPGSQMINKARAQHGSNVSIYFAAVRRIMGLLLLAGLLFFCILVIPPLTSKQNRDDMGNVWDIVDWESPLFGPSAIFGGVSIQPFLYGGFLSQYGLKHVPNKSTIDPTVESIYSSVYSLDIAWMLLAFIVPIFLILASLSPLNSTLLLQLEALRPPTITSRRSAAKRGVAYGNLNNPQYGPTGTGNPQGTNAGQGLLQASLVFCGLDMRETNQNRIDVCQRAIVTDLEMLAPARQAIVLLHTTKSLQHRRISTNTNGYGYIPKVTQEEQKQLRRRSSTASTSISPSTTSSVLYSTNSSDTSAMTTMPSSLQSRNCFPFRRNFFYFFLSIIFCVAFWFGVYIVSTQSFQFESDHVNIILPPIIISAALIFLAPLLDYIVAGEYIKRRNDAANLSIAAGARADAASITASFYRHVFFRIGVLCVLYYVAFTSDHFKPNYVQAATNVIALQSGVKECIGDLLNHSSIFCECQESKIGAFALRHVLIDIVIQMIVYLCIAPVKILGLKMAKCCGFRKDPRGRTGTFGNVYGSQQLASVVNPHAVKGNGSGSSSGGSGNGSGSNTHTNTNNSSAIELTSRKTKSNTNTNTNTNSNANSSSKSNGLDSFEAREYKFYDRPEFSMSRSTTSVLYWLTFSIGAAPYVPVLPLFTFILLSIYFLCRYIEIYNCRKRPSKWYPPPLQQYHTQVGILLFAILSLVPVAIFSTSTSSCGPFFYTTLTNEPLHDSFLRRVRGGPKWLAAVFSYISNSVFLWMVLIIAVVYALSTSRAVAIATYEREETATLLRREALERRVLFHDLSIELSENKLRGRRLMSQWVRSLTPDGLSITSSSSKYNTATAKDLMRIKYAIVLQREYPDLIVLCSMNDRQLYHALLLLKIPNNLLDEFFIRLKRAQFELVDQEYKRL